MIKTSALRITKKCKLYFILLSNSEFNAHNYRAIMFAATIFQTIGDFFSYEVFVCCNESFFCYTVA